MQIDALKGENLRVAVYHRVPIRVINQVSSYELIAKVRRDYVERNGWTYQGIYIDEGQPEKGRERLKRIVLREKRTLSWFGRCPSSTEICQRCSA